MSVAITALNRVKTLARTISPTVRDERLSVRLTRPAAVRSATSAVLRPRHVVAATSLTCRTYPRRAQAHSTSSGRSERHHPDLLGQPVALVEGPACRGGTNAREHAGDVDQDAGSMGSAGRPAERSVEISQSAGDVAARNCSQPGIAQRRTEVGDRPAEQHLTVGVRRGASRPPHLPSDDRVGSSSRPVRAGRSSRRRRPGRRCGGAHGQARGSHRSRSAIGRNRSPAAATSPQSASSQLTARLQTGMRPSAGRCSSRWATNSGAAARSPRSRASTTRWPATTWRAVVPPNSRPNRSAVPIAASASSKRPSYRLHSASRVAAM